MRCGVECAVAYLPSQIVYINALQTFCEMRDNESEKTALNAFVSSILALIAAIQTLHPK